MPVGIGYGLLALSPLGESAVPAAVLAGLYAAVFGCIVAVLLGANTTMVNSPRSIATFLIGSFVLHDIARSSLPFPAGAAPAMLLTLAFMLCFLTGAFQVLFGLLKLGNLIKYIPAPVIAGFQNAAAFLLFASQLDMMLGLPTHTPYSMVLSHLDEAKPLTIAIGITFLRGWASSNGWGRSWDASRPDCPIFTTLPSSGSCWAIRPSFNTCRCSWPARPVSRSSPPSTHYSARA